MAKRFISSDLWAEDWFLDMPSDYKLFWYYLLAASDHAGFFKVNLRSFRRLTGLKVDSSRFLKYINEEKQRVRIVSESVWFLEDFIPFQYGSSLDINNRVHKSILLLLNKHNINPLSIRGLKGVNHTPKDKDKDKDNSLTEKKKNEKNGKESWFSGNFKSQGEELFAHRSRTRRSKIDGDGEEDSGQSGIGPFGM